ncbi:RNA polymerase sigma factor [Dyella caseinilytica]|uniref:Sigma-70 family RNA polymerase sigma factor n=1 Tax=Dyella caseinilytica TaxID=1849581 RepID=A0ABX7GXM0_9GAMM|nr:sigma-70 family RNA polymerase sigma factor [Dyella caseinilytica]QRN54579.1 sigma-70 family RNA polymerase sigma factor [Dyella caseinilytica]GFZ95370.1 DNA-directed RNA polymerase sigma-70 factor [Dyella caseinilytica]
MSKHPDRPLVEAVLANAPGAFERLVREYQALCWHIIYRMVRHPEDARDLCQETFLRVHQSLHQYRFESTLKSWIGRVAYTIALRHLERKRIAVVDLGADEDMSSLVENIGDGFDLESAYASSEMAGHLHAAIEALPPMQRTVLTLYHLDELSIEDIAGITGLANGTIKSHLFRSRLGLRKVLESVQGVPS